MGKKNICLCLFLLIVHLSCVKEDIIRIEMGDAKLVLNAMFSPDQEVAIHLSKSFAGGDKSTDAELKEPAVVRVYINDQIRGIMIRDTAKSEDLNYTKIEGRYYLPGVKPFSGDEVRIEAEVPGYQTALVTTRIPEAPALLSVDTVRYSKTRNKEMMRLYVCIEDKIEQRDYYRMLLTPKVTKNNVGSIGSYASGSDYGYNYSNFWMVDYEDPVFTADLPMQSIASARSNEYGVFSDNLFNGEEYVLKLSFSNPQSSFKSDSVDVQVKYEIRLLSVSESYYHYYKQSASLSLNVGHIQLAPGRDNYMNYSNVKNGLGFVFSYNETKHVISMPYATTDPLIENREY